MGESIYGGPFEDELPYNAMRHSGPGLLSMAGSLPMRDKTAEQAMHVPNNNLSQFFVTTKAKNAYQGGSSIMHFDGRHVVFGRVVEGMKTINLIHKVPVDAATFHTISDEHKVEIVDCGQLKSRAEEVAEKEEADFQKLNPVFMIPDKAPEEPEPQPISRATWAALGADDKAGDVAEAPAQPPRAMPAGAAPPRPPPPRPTAADEAIISAEIEDDD